MIVYTVLNPDEAIVKVYNTFDEVMDIVSTYDNPVMDMWGKYPADKDNVFRELVNERPVKIFINDKDDYEIKIEAHNL
jgi:hypothetical protein